MARPADGGVKNTLETELVAAERGNGLLERLLSAAGGAAIAEAGNLDLLPGDGDVVGLEDGLDALGNLGTDTVTGNEGDGVLAAVLGGLEDVGLDRVLDAGEAARSVEALGGVSGSPEKALLEKNVSNQRIATILAENLGAGLDGGELGIGNWELGMSKECACMALEGGCIPAPSEQSCGRALSLCGWEVLKNEGIATMRRAAAARGREVDEDNRFFLDEKSNQKEQMPQNRSTKCTLAHLVGRSSFFTFPSSRICGALLKAQPTLSQEYR